MNCTLGTFLVVALGCAPCPPHTFGTETWTCQRCPEDSYAQGLGNTGCSPCLGSNFTADPISCPVLVPTYYYAAASSAAMALLLLMLLVAVYCVLQKRTVALLKMQLFDHVSKVTRRVMSNRRPEDAADDVAHVTTTFLTTGRDEDENDADETCIEDYDHDEDGRRSTITDTTASAAGVIDFEHEAPPPRLSSLPHHV